jgi:hypothetical protein
MRSHKVEKASFLLRVTETAEGFCVDGKDFHRAKILAVISWVSRTRCSWAWSCCRHEEMKSGLGLLAKPLGSIVAGSNFEVEAADFPAVILILDAQVGDGNLAVHDLEIKLVRNENSLIPRVFVGPHPREGLKEVFLQFKVESDAANLPA